MYKKLILLLSLSITNGLECTSHIPIHMAHEELCSKFYSCYNNNIRELQCPRGLYFDTVSQICLNSNEVNCGNRIRDDNQQDIDEYAAIACRDKTNENVPNPQDCASYYRCTNEVAVIEYCPANLYFDVKSNSCDWYYNVDCCEHKSSS